MKNKDNLYCLLKYTDMISSVHEIQNRMVRLGCYTYKLDKEEDQRNMMSDLQTIQKFILSLRLLELCSQPCKDCDVKEEPNS